MLAAALAALGRAGVRAAARRPTAPLTILVSFDGWRWDYDTKAPAPALRALMARGVRAEGLIPAFPVEDRARTTTPWRPVSIPAITG